jgi:hypothetical protein
MTPIPGEGVGQEVRMDRCVFDYIRDNNLWYGEGQLSAFAHKLRIAFPRDSVEVKAYWKEIGPRTSPISTGMQ